MHLAPLYGLVLAGGQSTRMGQDKGSLIFHSCDQRTYCVNILQQFCKETFISCRREQKICWSNFCSPPPLIYDENRSIGPANGMLAAHAFAPNYAWLVLACDFPWVDSDALAMLIAHRNRHVDAIVYRDPITGIDQPLIAIWEPQGLHQLKIQVAAGADRASDPGHFEDARAAHDPDRDFWRVRPDQGRCPGR